MEFQKSKFKEESLALHESLNKQFLSMFPDKDPGIPRQAWETCDLHLESKQPIQYIDAKGNGVNEITWDEPIDSRAELMELSRTAWALLSIISLIFVLIIYYWGKSNGL